MAPKVQVEYGIKDSMTTQMRRIEGEVTKFHAGISKKLTQYAGAALGGAAALSAIGSITSGFKTLFSESATAYKEAEKADAKLKAVLKSTEMQAGLTFSQLKKMAGGLQDVTTVDDEAIQGAQHLLLTFTKIGKEVFPDTLESVMNISEAMGGDLKSASIQVGKALQDPITGATALRRVGVALTQQQQEQIKSFVKMGDTASAQKIILQELQVEFGGLARAMAETETGQLIQIENKLGDIKEQIGKEIIPAQIAWNKVILKGLEQFNSILGVVNRAKYAMQGKDAGLYDVKSRVDEFTGDIEGLGKTDQLAKIDEYIKKVEAKDRDLTTKIRNLNEKTGTYVNGKFVFKNTANASHSGIVTNTGSFMTPANQQQDNSLETSRLQQEQKLLNAEVQMLQDYAEKVKVAKEKRKKADDGDGTGDVKNYWGKDKLLSNIESYKVPSQNVEIPQYMIDQYNKAQDAAKEHQDAILRIQQETANGKINAIENQFDRERAIVEARYRELYELADEQKIKITGLKDQEAEILARIDQQERQDKAKFVSSQLGSMAALVQGNRKAIGLYKTLAIAQIGIDTSMNAVTVSKQAYQQFGKINVYAGIAAAVVAAGIVTASGIAQSAKVAQMKYASGTQYATGGYARVGERGAEDMFVPRGAMITNNRETKYNSSSTTHMTANFYGVNGNQLAQYEADIRDGGLDGFVRTFTERAAHIS
jgi:hypothetical protein